MTNRTKIQWTDVVWNPVRGCSRVSEGCRNCYAERHAARFVKPGQAWHGIAERTASGPRWTGKVELVPKKLGEPLGWMLRPKPWRVFVNSMSDLFHESLSNEAIGAVFGVMAMRPDLTFQVLTKRPARMREWMRWAADWNGDLEGEAGERCIVARMWAWSLRFGIGIRDEIGPAGHARSWPLPNVWLGVSVEDQETADARIPILLTTPARVRFVSAEPLLGPIDFVQSDAAAMVQCVASGDSIERGVDWIIFGGESGPNARPCNSDWIAVGVAQCRGAGVPVFVKQLGANPWAPTPASLVSAGLRTEYAAEKLRDRKGGDLEEWPELLRVREFPR